MTSKGEGVSSQSVASIGPTAVMPAPTIACERCAKQNHIGVTSCVFCGHPVATSGASSEPPVDAKAASSGAHGTTAKSGVGMSSISVDVASSSDEEPPPSRRAMASSDDLGQAQPIADPLIGVIVAERYRILEAIGRGGMGIVYKVEHTRIAKLLAMKLLTGELSRNPDVVRRFKQEALTVSRLSSPNTVQVFDFGQSEGLTYLVMELVAGEDLGRALRANGPMPFSRLGKIVVQVCSSLAEAHQKGIVHRDIKPENIMLMRAARDGTDVAKVLDFGLAKLREGSELNDVTSQGAIVGTPYFMAPEQVRGEAVDARTDIYALGAVMYRGLTGAYPFTGTTPMAVFTKHLTEDAVPPHERAPELGIPPAVSRIVLKALAKDPAARWQKIEDLQLALVDELKSVSSSSVEDLLDSGQLRRLAKVAAEVEMKSMMGPAAPAAELATRDELVAYERKLRRLKYSAVGSGVLVVFAAAIGAAKLYHLSQKPAFDGHELEPNDSAAEAQPVPFGKPVTGYVGKRLDVGKSDIDFYAVDVPASGSGGRALVSLVTTALPNFATCTFLYKQGLSDPLARYCVGAPKKDLEIPALALEPGRYLVAVKQDLDAYGGQVPFVYENVSDAYTMTLGPARADEGVELEPNDQVATANTIAPGRTMKGRIGWARDEDVYCVAASAKGPVRWKVSDEAGRAANAVLEVIPIRGADEGAPVRVHTSGKPTSSSSDDVTSPWTSAVVKQDASARCLRVRLAPNTWSGERGEPRGGPEEYAITVEPAS
ncbi:MAG TPA: serine/threonine-protein kinase [Minicystis sp.]|nr:serine/threonine-protein kinase [Minicystis sp.]